MFWPKDHLFNCLKQLMLFCWLGSAGSLALTMMYQRQFDDNLSCGNQTDFQLFTNVMCESRNRLKEVAGNREQCYVNLLSFLLNVAITISMALDWFKIKFLRKWISFEFVRYLICLAAFHGWIYLNEIEYRFSIYYQCYLGLIAFQTLLTTFYEVKYFNRLIVYDFLLEDPMFDRKIISYSSKKIGKIMVAIKFKK